MGSSREPLATLDRNERHPVTGSTDPAPVSEGAVFVVRVAGRPVEFELMDEPLDLSAAGIARLDEQASCDVVGRAAAAGLGRRRFNAATDEPEMFDPHTVALADLDGYVDIISGRVGGRVPALQQVVVDVIGYYRLESIEAALGCGPGVFAGSVKDLVESIVEAAR